ncbi:hypothetical protein ABZ626_03540 [Streptomyces longispororuber]|uniref:hypothetical protein n=1 Tax=Streptomyces longispororuber TaxID=68230 RepID=UPI0033DB79B3
MSGILPAVALVAWLAGIIALALLIPGLLADDPLLRLAAQTMPVAVALYCAVVIVFWPAALLARAIDVLVHRGRS